MRGIILAGGSGSRLLPLTTSITKQILPIYDKPMIYYPLSVLMQAGIYEILIITTERDLPSIKDLLNDGSSLGITITYAVQPTPDGIAQSFIIGEKFIGNDQVCLILGDNIFYGGDVETSLKKACKLQDGGMIFAYNVNDPGRYGVVDFDHNGKVMSIEEKPKNPKSNWAVTGIYFYDNQVIDIAKSLKPSERGELEITDINKFYLEQENLVVGKLGRGNAWLDTGTFDSLLSAAQFVQTIEVRQGLKVSCIEEIAFQQGFIGEAQLRSLADKYGKNDYGKYLKRVLEMYEAV